VFVTDGSIGYGMTDLGAFPALTAEPYPSDEGRP